MRLLTASAFNSPCSSDLGPLLSLRTSLMGRGKRLEIVTLSVFLISRAESESVFAVSSKHLVKKIKMTGPSMAYVMQAYFPMTFFASDQEILVLFYLAYLPILLIV